MPPRDANAAKTTPAPEQSDSVANAASVQEVEAQELRTGWDLFGAGVITRVVLAGNYVRVQVGKGSFTLERHELVTVRSV